MIARMLSEENGITRILSKDVDGCAVGSPGGAVDDEDEDDDGDDAAAAAAAAADDDDNSASGAVPALEWTADDAVEMEDSDVNDIAVAVLPDDLGSRSESLVTARRRSSCAQTCKVGRSTGEAANMRRKSGMKARG